MTTLSKEYYEKLKTKAETVLDSKAKGETAREIMADIYVKGLPDKTKEQGLVMTDKALESIADFNREYAEAAKNKDDVFEKMLVQMIKGKSLVERCNIFSELYIGAEAAKAKMAGEDEEVVDEILLNGDRNQISEEEATEALEADLRAKVLDSFENTSILSRGLIRQADQLEEMIAEAGISQVVVQIGEDETEYEGILTMLAYVDSKESEIKELPPDLSIEETAYIVAATVEEERIIKRYTLGEIATNTAVALLDILGVVLLLKLSITLIGLGVAIAVSLCGMIMAIPAAIFVTAGIMGVFGEAIKLWFEDAKDLVNAMGSVVKLGARAASAAMRKLGEFIESTVAPIVSGFVDTIKDFFDAIKTKTKVVEMAKSTI